MLHQLAQTNSGTDTDALRSGVRGGLDECAGELRVEGSDEERDLFQEDCKGLQTITSAHIALARFMRKAEGMMTYIALLICGASPWPEMTRISGPVSWMM